MSYNINVLQQTACLVVNPIMVGNLCIGNQGSHRLEKYLNIQACLEKSLKIKFALKST